MDYLLKYIHAARANNTIAKIQRDESVIPVFLAMSHPIELFAFGVFFQASLE